MKTKYAVVGLKDPGCRPKYIVKITKENTRIIAWWEHNKWDTNGLSLSWQPINPCKWVFKYLTKKQLFVELL
jgi:hypothetical protein